MQRETKFCERQQAASQQIQGARKTTRQWSTTDIPTRDSKARGRARGKRSEAFFSESKYSSPLI
ncbi:hypothetical protein PLICRDRAFT_40687 [Plicaturopsis crispa FD-325 SS-3]|nr:hypothetical protein PLICRDRAFT_40687 [Plicaturopsis crispa FD-325 SS-3]